MSNAPLTVQELMEKMGKTPRRTDTDTRPRADSDDLRDEREYPRTHEPEYNTNETQSLNESEDNRFYEEAPSRPHFQEDDYEQHYSNDREYDHRRAHAEEYRGDTGYETRDDEAFSHDSNAPIPQRKTHDLPSVMIDDEDDEDFASAYNSDGRGLIASSEFSRNFDNPPAFDNTPRQDSAHTPVVDQPRDFDNFSANPVTLDIDEDDAHYTQPHHEEAPMQLPHSVAGNPQEPSSPDTHNRDIEPVSAFSQDTFNEYLEKALPSPAKQHTGLATAATALFFPFGAVAMSKDMEVLRHAYSGDATKSKKASSQALTWAIFGIIVGAIMWTALAVYIFEPSLYDSIFSLIGLQ